MKRKEVYGIFLFALMATGSYAQQAEYTTGNNWVHPGGQKFIGMDFINSSTGTLMNNGTVWYSGNFTNNGMVDFDNSLVINPASSLFAGDTLQHITGTGTTHFYSLMFGSQLTPSAYSLEQNISVAHRVDFTKGILTTLQTTPETRMNLLQLENGATCIHASDNSFVDGFVSKTGNSAFTFPIGNRGFYRPASIGTPEAVTDCFAARYLYANPDNAGYTRTKKVAILTYVSNKEYWVVNRTNGSGNGQLTLSWDTGKTSAPIPDNLNKLVVARWDGAKWINEGNIGVTGNATAGTVTANVTGYGVFTLAAIPVRLLVAVNDTLTTNENIPATCNVLGNDSVFNGATLSVTSFSINGTPYQPGATAIIPNAGTIILGADGIFSYMPALMYNGVLPAITYTIGDGDSNTDTSKLIVDVLDMPELLKTADKPVMNNDGTFSWSYTLTLQNDTHTTISNLQVEDNLDVVFKDKGCSYTVTGISATGKLTANGLYDGSAHINTLVDGSSLAPGQLDSILVDVKVDTRGQQDMMTVFNQATLKATTPVGDISAKSRADLTTLGSEPTQTDIPVVHIVIPDGFSPNGDGLNDKFVMTHPITSRIDIEVFSRNGNSVYKHSDYQNDWDGKGSGSFLGRDLVDGTYYCAYTIIEISSGKIINKGVKFITLRR